MNYEQQFDSPRKGSVPERRNEYSAASAHPPPPRGTCGEHHEPVTPPAAALRAPVTSPAAPSAGGHAAGAPERRLRRPAPPLFPPPVQRSRCRTAAVTTLRVFISLFSVVMVVFAILGQVLPFCHFSDGKKEEEKYSVWQLATTKTKKAKTEREAREDNAAEKAFAVLAAALSLIACVLCFVFVGLWVRFEQARRREADAYAEAKHYTAAQEMQGIHYDPDVPYHHGHHHGEDAELAHPTRQHRMHHGEAQRHDSFKCDGPTAYPQAFGTKEEMYARERHRQRVDRDVGIAAFAFLMAAAAASLVTVALMGHFYNEEVADEVEAKKGESAGYMVGFGLFIAALALGVVSFVLLALPCLTELYLCCGPQARTPKTPLDSPISSSFSVPAAAVAPPPATQVAAKGAKDKQRVSNCADNNNNSASHDIAAAPSQPAETRVHHRESPHSLHPQQPQPPPPQPYVPTVVGTYPEALPGPANMDNVRLHHVAHDGTTTDLQQHPSTQVAWRGDEAASGQFVASARRGSREEQSGYASGGYYTSA